MSEKHLSTTALARQLHKESKELFILLAQGGWIIKVDNHWQLTEKGKFEGGIYLNHPKYGDYIAWPESVREHPLLQLLPEAPLSATHLASKLELPARLVNLLLAERGWIKKHIRGWLLTLRGKALGGEQHTSEQSGVPFVTWPESLLDNTHLLRALAQIKGESYAHSPLALTGQRLSSRAALIVENWLYLAGINHACNYALAEEQGEQLRADFYIPELQIAIDIWGAETSAAALANKLHKQDFYQKQGYDYLEIHDENIIQLDDLLARQLLGFGLAVY